MINLRKTLQSYLLTIHPRVYFQDAPENAVFPYIVVDFPTTLDDGEEFQNVVVDIDIWDSNNTNDTTTLETLAETIDSILNKTTISNSDLSVTFYLDNKLSIIDDDKRIKRRKYIYQARLWEVI